MSNSCYTVKYQIGEIPRAHGDFAIMRLFLELYMQYIKTHSMFLVKVMVMVSTEVCLSREVVPSLLVTWNGRRVIHTCN